MWGSVFIGFLYEMMRDRIKILKIFMSKILEKFRPVNLVHAYFYEWSGFLSIIICTYYFYHYLDRSIYSDILVITFLFFSVIFFLFGFLSIWASWPVDKIQFMSIERRYQMMYFLNGKFMSSFLTRNAYIVLQEYIHKKRW